MKKLLLGVATFALMLSLTMPGNVFAQTSSQTDTHPAKSCEQVQERLTRKINRWQERKENVVEKWTTRKDRIQKIIAKLQEKGYDVTKLEEDVKVVEGLIDEMHVSYDDVIAKALEARSNACSDKDVFKKNMNDLKDLIENARENWKEFKDFMKNQFIPDIKSYKETTPTL